MTSGNCLKEKAFPPDPIFHFGLLSLSFLIVRINTFEILTKLNEFFTEGYRAYLKHEEKNFYVFFLLQLDPVFHLSL